MIDKYFRFPLILDYIFGLIVISVLLWFNFKGYYSLPEQGILLQISSDISNVSLTLAGFIMTLLTVLITYKMGTKVERNLENQNPRVLDVFFSSDLYSRTLQILKGCIGSLIFISILGFILKSILRGGHINYLFFSNILGIIIIVTSLGRSLFILTKVVGFQDNDLSEIDEQD